MPNGYVNQTTQIVNYPVQGFATADVVPCGVIGVWRLWKQHNLKSLLILTVHDSLYVDCYPDEKDIVVELLKKGLLSINEIFLELYGIPMEYPLAIEIKEGYNAFNMKEIKFKYYET
jgi:DNA polymerase-1